MPEVEIERRTGPAVPWWVWLLVALLVLGLLWWLLAANNAPQRVADTLPGTTTTTAGAPEGVDEAAVIPVDQIILVPANYLNQNVSGTTRVAEVISDRGFWIEENGQRIFVALAQGVPETPPDVNVGQRIFLTGTVEEPDNTQVGGLEADAQKAIQGQPAFIRATSVRILDGVGAATGTTDAAGMNGAAGTTDGAAATTTGTGTTPVGQGVAQDLAAIGANPANYIGQTVSVTATVPQVISDRGFWVEAGGQRMFAILRQSLDSPEVPPDVNAGQTVRFQATVLNPDEAARLPDIEPETRQALQGQKAILHVTRIEILNR
ncbi:MAG: hypothetical protein KY468_15620 [Armatimonadetes bacterium]|nr:hypothetical protein [Armatimonadota bacterium]